MKRLFAFSKKTFLFNVANSRPVRIPPLSVCGTTVLYLLLEKSMQASTTLRTRLMQKSRS